MSKAAKDDAVAKDRILEYINSHNRPFSVQMIVDGFRNEIKKAQTQRSVDALVADGKINLKEWGKSKIYFAIQESLQKMNQEELNELDKEIGQKTENLNELRSELRKLESEYSRIMATPTDAELDKQLKEAEKEVEQLTARIKPLEDSRGTTTAADFDKVKQNSEKHRLEWKKRKRICFDILGSISEGSGKKMKDLFNTIGVETDEEAGVDFEKSETSKYMSTLS